MTPCAGSPSSAPRSAWASRSPRIREALALLPENRTPTREDWARVSECWRNDLNERIKLMTQLRDHLTECIGCGCLSLSHCALANPYDKLGEEGPGARSLACCDGN